MFAVVEFEGLEVTESETGVCALSPTPPAWLSKAKQKPSKKISQESRLTSKPARYGPFQHRAHSRNVVFNSRPGRVSSVPGQRLCAGLFFMCAVVALEKSPALLCSVEITDKLDGG